MGKKKDILDALLADCLESGDMVFDNKKVRELGEERDFTNQFDVTKLDNKKAISPLMIERDYFLVHLGKGGINLSPALTSRFTALRKCRKAPPMCGNTAKAC